MDSHDDFTYVDAYGEDEDNEVTAKKTKTKSDVSGHASCTFFINRILFCLIAQLALWSTTLRNSTIIASDYISVPTFSSVYDSCDQAHRVIIEEKGSYDYCVRNQLARCNRDFEMALNQENFRVSSSVENNDNLMSLLQIQLSNCSTVIYNSKLILQSWNTRKSEEGVFYNNSCTHQNQQQLQAYIGEDHSTSYQASSSAVLYAEKSNVRMFTMSTYTRDLTNYNIEYIQNKTEELHLLSLGKIEASVNIKLQQFDYGFRSIYNLTDDILACMSLNEKTVAQCEFSGSLYDEYVIAQTKLQNQIDNMYNAIQLYRQVAENYVINVQIAIKNANKFYQSIMGDKGLIRWLVDTVKILYSLGDMCGNSVPNFCSFSPENWEVPLPQWPIISDDINFPDASILFQRMQGYVATINPRINKISKQMKDKIVSLEEDLYDAVNSIDWVPNDYNPPQYSSLSNSTADEVDAQQQDSQEYLQRLQNILYNSTNTGASSSTVRLTDITTILSPFSVNTTWVRNKSRTMWSIIHKKSLSWSIGNFDYIWILESFMTLQGILFLFDYLYRGVQSLRLLTRFWSRSIMKLPTIECKGGYLAHNEETKPTNKPQNKSKSKSKGIDKQQKTSVKDIKDEENAMFNSLSSTVHCLELFFRLLPLFWVQALVLLAMIVAIIFVISALIIPEYHSYCRACVHHTANETFISQIAHTAAYNLAAASGNTRWTSGVKTYDTQSYAACDRGTATTQQSYLQSLQTMQNINQSYAAHVKYAQLLRECVDFQAMDEAITSSCCVNRNCEYRNLSKSSTCPSYLQVETSHPILLHDLWYSSSAKRTTVSPFCQHDYLLYESSTTDEIEWANNHGQHTKTALFDCSALSSCQLTCDGPNDLLIRRHTKDCSCRLEWFWNGHLLQGTLVIVIFLVLNISRDLICSGLLRIWWSQFLPPIIPVLIDIPIEQQRQQKLKNRRVKQVQQTHSNHKFEKYKEKHTYDIEESKQPVQVVEDDKTVASDADAIFDAPEAENDAFSEISCSTSVTQHNSDSDDENPIYLISKSVTAKATAIQEKVRWRLFWFVSMGYMKIIVGLSINYLWYSFALTIQRNISYDSNPYPESRI